MGKELVIAVDFDGTVVTHDYPNIGKDIDAVPVLKQLIENGHKIVLNTMRSGAELDAAVQWFVNTDISLYGVNENPTQKEWTLSPKIYAHIYIDDASLGCPLMMNEQLSSTAFVDWKQVRFILKQMGVL